MAENSNSNSRENARVSVVLSATALQLTSPAGDITELCYRHILESRSTNNHDNKLQSRLWCCVRKTFTKRFRFLSFEFDLVFGFKSMREAL